MNSIVRSSRSKNRSRPGNDGVFLVNILMASLVCILAIILIIDGWTPWLALLGSLESSIPPLKHSRHGVLCGIIVVIVPICLMTPP